MPVICERVPARYAGFILRELARWLLRWLDPERGPARCAGLY